MPHATNRPITLSRRSLLAGMSLALASAGRATAQTPAPVAGDAFASRIGALLAAAPARDLAPAVPLYYADLAAQLASVGVDRPSPGDTADQLPPGFIEAVLALPLAARAFEVARDPRWVPTFGFDPYAVGQVLLLTSEGTVSMFRDIDADAVRKALAASGYREVEHEHGSYVSVGDELAPETVVGELGLGTMNHAIVAEDLVVFAGREADIVAVGEVLAGASPSMASQALWTGLVAPFSGDTVGMIPVAPAAARPPGWYPWQATPTTAVGTLESLALGVRAGSRAAPFALVGEGTPQATPAGAAAIPARVEAHLRYADAPTATREAGAIPSRWRAGTSAITGGPLDELMRIVEARVSPGDPQVVDIDFVADTPNRWSQMIHAGDLAALLPAAG